MTNNWPATRSFFSSRTSLKLKWSPPAANGLEAVKLIEDLEPELVFLDVQMPGLDGMGVIRQIAREKHPPAAFRPGHGLRSVRGGGIPLGSARLCAQAGGERTSGRGGGARAQVGR